MHRVSNAARVNGRTLVTSMVAGCIAASWVQPTSGQTPDRAPLRLIEIRRVAAVQHDLSDVGSVTLGPDSTIWVSQPQDGNVIGIRRRGGPRVVIGSKGQGPGEFMAVHGLVADTRGVTVQDRQLKRFVHFDPSGRADATTAIQVPNALPRSIMIGGSSETAIFRSQRYPDPTVEVYSIAPNGTVGARLFVDQEGGECSRRVVSERGSSGLSVPLCHQPRYGVSPSAKVVVRAQPISLPGSATAIRVVIVQRGGDTVAASTHELGASPISRSVRDSTIARLRARSRFPALADEVAGLIPSTYPPVSGVEVADNGEAWITTRSGPRGSHGLLVVAPDGRARGYAPIPASWRIGWVGGGLVLVVEEQDDGLQDVVLYRVEVGP